MFELSTEALDPDALRQRIEDLGCGAVVLFEGRVRDRNRERPVERIVYEAYAAVALAEGQAVVAEMRLSSHTNSTGRW